MISDAFFSSIFEHIYIERTILLRD